MKTQKIRQLFLLGTLVLSAAIPALQGATISFTDTLTRDDEVRLFGFTTTAAGVVDLITNSYAGGGFSPVLSLFQLTDSGLLIGRDNGVDHPSGDAALSLPLSAGQYVAAVTVFDNLAVGPRLSDSFLRTGSPNFTREFGPPGNTSSFLNIDGQARTGRFSLTLGNVATAAAVPEPGSLLLTAIGAVCLFTGYRRKRA